MKLSEAIRLGSMLRPQSRRFEPVRVRGWRGWLLRETTQGSCALAAASEAVGHGSSWTDVLLVWPFVYTTTATHPATGESGRIIGIVWSLNDTYEWTREAIAEWVATVEPAESSGIVESPVTADAVSGQTVGS